MITPLNEAPASFLKRYNRIKNGREIDTVTRLKNFWLFAVEQGKEHREMREYIARLASDVPVTHQVRDLFVSDFAVQESYLSFTGFVSVVTTEESDTLWKQAENMIATIEEDRLDKHITQHSSLSQLSTERAAKVARHIMKMGGAGK